MEHCPAHPKSREHAFSVLQLLLVIAIVIVLTGMLFPLVGRTRDELRQIGCVSRLQQVGIAMNSYAVEHNNRFPEIYDGAFEDKRQTWMARLAPYAGLTPSEIGNSPYPRSNGIFVCPAFSEAARLRREVSYRYNYAIHWVWNYKRMALLQRPIFLVVEAEGANEETFNIARAAVSSRHPGKTANYLLTDGRVESLRVAIPSNDPLWGTSQ